MFDGLCWLLSFRDTPNILTMYHYRMENTRDFSIGLYWHGESSRTPSSIGYSLNVDKSSKKLVISSFEIKTISALASVLDSIKLSRSTCHLNREYLPAASCRECCDYPSSLPPESSTLGDAPCARKWQ